MAIGSLRRHEQKCGTSHRQPYLHGDSLGRNSHAEDSKDLLGSLDAATDAAGMHSSCRRPTLLGPGRERRCWRPIESRDHAVLVTTVRLKSCEGSPDRSLLG